ncbi:hypothetical protein MY092_002248 [Salmonella enterica]|nr:hypothetical protein [Salmonella enterica]EKQ9927502.1 hypothetical protein [Salmonella enterica subsp. enterica serovar Panama]
MAIRPVILAFRIQPTRGRLYSETPALRAAACAITFGLDALTACHMGVMSWLDAGPEPPGAKTAHRPALRATTPFKTLRLACFFFAGSKKRERCFKGGGRA